MATDQFGVYVHVPFCSKRCDYCAFATFTDRHHLAVDYMHAVKTHIERTVASGMPKADSMFVGGGTPSMVPAELLAEVIAAIPRSADAEVTVECNPDNITPKLLRTYVDAGVNRISLGVQSTVPHVLTSLGREHDRANVVRAVEWVRESGVRSFNLDVIYGGHGESLGDWRTTVEDVVALDPPHVSAYALTVEPGTPLADDHARHPDDDDQAGKYELVDDLLVANGLANYEISNWAKAGHECRHNRIYWLQGDYAAFGSAAHGHHVLGSQGREHELVLGLFVALGSVNIQSEVVLGHGNRGVVQPGAHTPERTVVPLSRHLIEPGTGCATAQHMHPSPGIPWVDPDLLQGVPD